jgi:hypothetical protein
MIATTIAMNPATVTVLNISIIGSIAVDGTSVGEYADGEELDGTGVEAAVVGSAERLIEGLLVRANEGEIDGILVCTVARFVGKEVGK